MELYSPAVEKMAPSGCGIPPVVSTMQCSEDIQGRSQVWRSVPMAEHLRVEVPLEMFASGMSIPDVNYVTYIVGGPII